MNWKIIIFLEYRYLNSRENSNGSTRQEFQVSFLGALKYSSVSQNHQIKDMSNQALAYRAMGDATIINANSWLYKDPEKPNTLPQSVLPKGGFYNKNEYKMLSYDFRLAATYNREFNETHILNSYAGAEVNSQERSSDWSEGWGMQYDNGELPFFDYLPSKECGNVTRIIMA